MSFLKIAVGFIPWIAFALLANRPDKNAVALAALVALLIALLSVARAMLRGSTPKILDTTAFVVFVVIAIVGFVGGSDIDRFLSDYGQPIASLVLAVVIFALLAYMPFTEQYARETVPQEFWHTPRFRTVNRRISVVWGLAIAAMGCSQILATVLQHADLDRNGIWDLILNWIVPIVAVVDAVRYTRKEAGSADEKIATVGV